MKARIFNIQKFSVNDGPGVRTTVFFKGCPLRCKWCANPESQVKSAQLMWDRDKCLHCETCVHLAPDNAMTHTDGIIRFDPAKCDDVNVMQNIVDHCPANALTIEGEMKTVDEVVDECLKDKDFYEESGGGVTLSGGEALMWPDFAVELLQKLHDNGVHTAIETTGFAPSDTFQRVAEHLDCFLFDMKHWDEQRHKDGTGVSNKIILANMKTAIDMGKDVLPRIPVIPGYNDAPEDAKGLARTLHEVGATRCQLLPFHQLGEKKYQLLSRDYDLNGVRALTADDLEDYRQIMVDEGIDAFF